jgi:hypothetical protein
MKDAMKLAKDTMPSWLHHCAFYGRINALQQAT